MRDYAIILPEFWIGSTGRVLRTKDPSVRELACYLFSAPNSSMYGLYYKPIQVMVLETGRSEQMVLAALNALEDLQYCLFDIRTDFVWVLEMCEIQLRPLPLKTGDYKIAAANKWYLTLPKNPFLGVFYDKYSEKLRFDSPRRNEGTVTLRKHTAGEGTKEASLLSTSTSTSTSTSLPDLVPTDHGFEAFWQAYPQTRRVGKKCARIEWNKVKPDAELTARIISAVERQKRTTAWLKEGGAYVPHPERYIKNRRWEDEDDEGLVLSSRTTNSMKAAMEFAAEGGGNGESGSSLLLGEVGGSGDSDGQVQRAGEAGDFGLLGDVEGYPASRDRSSARRVHEGVRGLPLRR